MFLSQRAYGQCSNPVNPTQGPQTYNGVTVTEVARTGAINPTNQPAPGCGGENLPQGSLGLGTAVPYGGTTFYSYTLRFSQPVNNVVFNIAGVEINESHNVSTNAGTVSLIEECNNGVSIYGTNMRSQGFGRTAGNARIRINSTSPFTELTFKGNGILQRSGNGMLYSNGSAANLCSGTIVPAVAPAISGISPATQTRCYNKAAQAITVTATGATSYQWWVNTTNSQTGATSISGATSASYTPPVNSPVGTLYYYAVATNSTGSTTSPIANVITQSCITTCYKPGAIATAGTPALVTKVGITSLSRAGAQNADNWPTIRKGGWLALEAKTKGFVPNRLAFDGSGNPVGIVPANFVEGMLVYDTTNKCLKMYTSKDGSATLGWYCITTQTCPD